MQTFDDFAREVLADRHRDGVRGIKSEYSRYRLHIQPTPLAGLLLDAIEPQHVDEWLRGMAEKKAHDTRGDRKLEKSSIRRSQALLSAVLAEAVDRGHIKTNPAQGRKIKRRDGASATKDKWGYLTLEEQERLLKHEGIDFQDRLAMSFAIHTGLRQGEQMCLKLDDLHVDEGEGSPRVYVRYGSPGLPPKSGKTREVPLFGDGLRIARHCKGLAESHPNNPLKLVFPTPRGAHRPVGKPLGRARVKGKHECAWKAALKTAGIERNIRWHDLRHTCASNLVSGVLGRRWTLEEIQVLMGHSSITMTQRYAHLGADALKRAAQETANAMVVHEEEAPPSSLVRMVVARVLESLKRAS